MDNNNIRNIYNNSDIDYELSYLIMKNNKILGLYDNPEITCIKYINLISNELDILDKLRTKVKERARTR